MSLSESGEASYEKQCKTNASQRQSFRQELQLHSEGPVRKRYGNMLVLLKTNRFLIILGPDYMCFLTAFISFFVAGCYLIIVVNQTFENIFLKIVNILIVIAQLGSYLLVAVSDPGIVVESPLPDESQHEQDVQRYCRKCKLQMVKNMHHCHSCDVCVRDYDHHCPWVSKCIGGSNLKHFYFFVGMTPFYLVYYIVVFFICFSISMSKQEGLPK